MCFLFTVSILSWFYFLIYLFILHPTWSFHLPPSFPPSPSPLFPTPVLSLPNTLLFCLHPGKVSLVFFFFFFGVACLLLFWNRFFFIKDILIMVYIHRNNMWMWISEFTSPPEELYTSFFHYMLKLLYACTEFNQPWTKCSEIWSEPWGGFMTTKD